MKIQVLCLASAAIIASVCVVLIMAQNDYTDSFFNNAWLPIEIDNPFAGLFFVGFKYGQATCVEPFFGLAKRVCLDEVVGTPFEPFLDVCIGCLLITDLSICVPPCRPNNYTCEFYPAEIGLIATYKFVNKKPEELTLFAES